MRQTLVISCWKLGLLLFRVRGCGWEVLRGSGTVETMSTLSVRAPGLQATTVLDARSLRVRGVTTLEGVRRNLFGCTDREENRRFVERELARQLELDSQRWGFDFANETPLPGAQRFAWQLVPASTIPAALRRSPITMTTPKQSTPKQEPKVSSPESKTQKRITGQYHFCSK